MTQRVWLFLAVSSDEQAKDTKTSLPSQETQGYEFARQYGYTVTNVLKVAGHSRSEPDYEQFMANMRKWGVTAYDDLRTGWEQDNFDILWARDSERLARNDSVLLNIVNNVIVKRGKRIYLENERAWFDQTNYRLMKSFSVFTNNMQLEGLKKKQYIGVRDRVMRGLNHSQVAWYHNPIRNSQTGKIERLAVNETHRWIYDLIAEHTLEGTGFSMIAKHFNETGIPNPAGQAKWQMRSFTVNFLYRPKVWGNAGWKTRRLKSPAFLASFDPDFVHLLPDDSEMFYGVDGIQPIYTGEIAILLQQELRRRVQVKGRGMHKRYQRMFTGMGVCGTCGYGLIYFQPKGRKPTLICDNRRYGCTDSARIREHDVQQYIHNILIELQHKKGATAIQQLFGINDNQTVIAGIESELATIPIKRRNLVTAMTTGELSPELMREITLQDNELIQQENSLKQELQVYRALSIQGETFHMAVEQIRDIDLKAFWSQSKSVINNQLRRLFGKYAFVAGKHTIAGFQPRKPKSNNHYPRA